MERRRHRHSPRSGSLSRLPASCSPSADLQASARKSWSPRRTSPEARLYHHYDGKEGVFEAVVDTVMQEAYTKLVTEMAALSDPLQALERGIGVFLEVGSSRACREYCSSMRRRFLVGPSGARWMRGTDWGDQAGSVRSDESGVDGSTGPRRPRASSVGSSDGGGDGRRPIAQPIKLAQGRRAGTRADDSILEARGLMQRAFGQTRALARECGKIRAPL